MRTKIYPNILQKYVAPYMPMMMSAKEFTRAEKELYILQAIERCSQDFADFASKYQKGTKNIADRRYVGLWCKWDDDERIKKNWITLEQLYEKFATQL